MNAKDFQDLLSEAKRISEPEQIIIKKEQFAEKIVDIINESEVELLQKTYPVKSINEGVLDSAKEKVMGWIEDYLANDTFIKDVTNMLLQRLNIKIEY
jgi:hypothetical protein